MMALARRVFCLLTLSMVCGPIRAAEAPGAKSGMAMRAKDALAVIDGRLDGFVGALLAAPNEYADVHRIIATGVASGEGVRAITSAIILLLVGGGIEWFYWTYAIGPLRLIESVRVRSPRHAVGLGLRRFMLGFLGVAAFALSTLIASTSFTWASGVDAGLITAVLLVVFVRIGWLVIDLVFAPHRQRLRPVDMEMPTARRMALLSIALVALSAVAILVPDFLAAAMHAQNLATSIHFVAATASVPLLIAIAAGGVKAPPRAKGRFSRLRLPRFPSWFLSSGLIVGVYLAWLVQGFVLAAFLAVGIAAIFAQARIGPFVMSLWRDRTEANGGADMPSASDPLLLPVIIVSLARLALIVLALILMTLVLDIPIDGMANSDLPLARFTSRVVQVAALLMLAHVGWTIIRSSINHRLALIGPIDPHGEPGPNARLLTLLPLLRTTSAALLIGAAILASMWALGIEITPLLAGAGVVGIALGFGAQALVRDVIAGVFYLAEDVFRIGEYIESGPSTKGTVEHITLRTVALRHHNGPLHFVPYGALGTVRNTSRDWVIDKFNLPLPIDVDSEKIRKLIKKVGEEMLLDPEIGPLMGTPLKGKLSRIEPGVKIFRCNFQTTPGKQFDVRSAAYKRIEARLAEAGIAYANSGQVVYLQSPAGIEASEPGPRLSESRP